MRFFRTAHPLPSADAWSREPGVQHWPAAISVVASSRHRRVCETGGGSPEGSAGVRSRSAPRKGLAVCSRAAFRSRPRRSRSTKSRSLPRHRSRPRARSLWSVVVEPRVVAGIMFPLPVVVAVLVRPVPSRAFLIGVHVRGRVCRLALVLLPNQVRFLVWRRRLVLHLDGRGHVPAGGIVMVGTLIWPIFPVRAVRGRRGRPPGVLRVIAPVTLRPRLVPIFGGAVEHALGLVG